MQLIAMHGWAGDARGWGSFELAWQARGWRWQCGERGYGIRPPQPVDWRPQPGPRVLVAHSLGPHLLPAAVLEQADALVLLASFGRFVPEGREGRRLQTALAAMAAQLADTENAAAEMLQTFLERAAAPQPASLLPPSPAAAPLPLQGRRRLLEDLELLGSRTGLPPGYPIQVPTLIVEAAADQIVVPEARRLLREALPGADRIELAGIGHGLLSPALVPLVCGWLEALA